MKELTAIRAALNIYRDFILNVRVGCTDLSSFFGVRRNVYRFASFILLDPFATPLDMPRIWLASSNSSSVTGNVYHTIYDILPVADCLSDMLNVFSEYVISGPVWEYFKTGIEEERDEDAISGTSNQLEMFRF